MIEVLTITSANGREKEVEVEFEQGSIDYDMGYVCGGTPHEIIAVYTQCGEDVMNRLSDEYLEMLLNELDKLDIEHKHNR